MGWGESFSGVSNAAQGAGRAAAEIGTDPARANRAILTGGVSEIYKASTDPAKKKAEEAQSAQDAAAAEGVSTQKYYLGKMGADADTAYEAQKTRMEGYKGNRSSLDKTADAAGSTYSNTIRSAEEENQGRMNTLLNHAQDQATKADTTYTNTIQPSFKNGMEKADNNASQAMRLTDAGDMNNPVQQGVRSFFEQQATNQGRQGLADVGVMQSLGAQANNQQMSAGRAMSGSQMQLMQASNGAQAGQAFANTQKRMQNLRDQGVEQGIAQSSAQYDRGQQAVNTASNQRQGFLNAESQNTGRAQASRGEQQGFGNAISGSKQRVGGTDYNRDMSQYARNVDRSGQFYNLDTGLANQRLSDTQMRNQMSQDIDLGAISDERMKAYGQMQAANSQMAATNQMIGAGIQGAATGVGAYFGGSQGAAAGSQAGGAVGGGVAGGLNSQGMAYGQAPQQQRGVSYYGGGYG